MATEAMVLVVDEDASVRADLERVLRSGGYAVEAFEDARALLARLADVDAPCCIVSELRMRGMDGLSLQEAVRTAGGAAPVVFLTAWPDLPTALRAMKRGALDVLEKPVSADELLAVVAAAVARARAERERRRRADDLRGRYRTLSPRERQVFALVTAGLLNKQVGWELGTSEKTVKAQRARVVEKMGARSLADLVRMADRLGVMAPPPGATLDGWVGPRNAAAVEFAIAGG